MNGWMNKPLDATKSCTMGLDLCFDWLQLMCKAAECHSYFQPSDGWWRSGYIELTLTSDGSPCPNHSLQCYSTKQHVHVVFHAAWPSCLRRSHSLRATEEDIWHLPLTSASSLKQQFEWKWAFKGLNPPKVDCTEFAQGCWFMV